MASCNFRKSTVEYWNGGLPAACLRRSDSGSVVHLESSHLPLGILDQDRFDDSTRVLEMHVDDRLLLCTDGVIEACNAQGEQFGFERFEEIVRGTGAQKSVFDELKAAVYRHMGSTGIQDDITLAEFTMVSEASSLLAVAQEVAQPLPGSEQWKLAYELGPRSLRGSNPLPLLQHVLMEVPQLRSHAGEIYTVLAELYSNALEHGLMGLDSQLKCSPEGFASYYRARAEGLQQLKGYVRFEFDCRIQGNSGELKISVKDSGPGFDYASRLGNVASIGTAYHGRGIRLLEKLCKQIEYRGVGNHAEVVFEWGNIDD
jgi:anti-sigma regulatory factor (Ser/Thr protein kinase)